MNTGKSGAISVFIVMLIVAACAKISAPTGGLRDRIPPEVIESKPVNKARNFKGNKISVTFNEYIVLDNINEKFMISPPTRTKPRVYTRGKSVNVEFDDKLRDSTTYTLYFLDAVKDLNEGNVIENYQFVFATGSELDSLSVTGNVYNAYDLEVPEKTTVMLYRDLNDSAVIKNMPDYLSRIDVNGYFRIDNVRSGSYRLYAIKDDDNSKSYNRVEEEFAFIDSVITVNPEKNYIPFVPDTTTRVLKPGAPKPPPPLMDGDHSLYLFAGPKKAHYLTGSNRETKYKLMYTFSLPPDTMDVEFSIPGTGEDKYIMHESRLRDTLIVWLTDSTLYSEANISTVLKYPFTDTLGIPGYKEDTIPMRFLAPRAPKSKRPVAGKTALPLQTNLAGGVLKPGHKIVFRSETPLKEPDTSRISLFQVIDKKTQRIPFSINPGKDPGRLILDATLPEGNQFMLITDANAISNIFGERNDSAGYRFSVKTAEDFSKLIIHVHNCNTQCIIQLLDNSEKLVGEKIIKKDSKIEFPLLSQGNYRMKVIYDLDGNGRWTTGDFMTRRQPEPVSYYGSEIEIKEGWEATQDWDLTLRHQKDPGLWKKKTR
jgi:hypothetical protein